MDVWLVSNKSDSSLHCKCGGTVVHDAGIVVAKRESVEGIGGDSRKVSQQAVMKEVLPQKRDVLIAIRAGVLVEESDGVSYLVDDCWKEATARTKGDRLRLEVQICNTTNKGRASVEGKEGRGKGGVNGEFANDIQYASQRGYDS